MSHFTCLVVLTPAMLAARSPDEALNAALQPFHEYECTGENDQYVQEIDETEEHVEGFKTDTRTRIRTPDGRLLSPYGEDPEIFRDPTSEELAELGRWCGSFGRTKSGATYVSRYWGDGLGHRVKIQELPPGYEEVEVGFATIEDWASYYDHHLVPFGEQPRTQGEKALHRFGYVQLAEDGSIAKAVRRTNPNKRWDWWVIGGRYKNRLPKLDGTTCDQLARAELDFAQMVGEKRTELCQEAEKYREATRGLQRMETFEEVGKRLGQESTMGDRREVFFSQPAVRAVKAALDGEDSFFMDWDRVASLVNASDEELPRLIERNAKNDATTWALLHDGNWTERGEMGWWGVNDATDESTKNYADDFFSALRDLPPDAQLVVVDCHI